MSDETLIQGSDEWLAARCGKVTASRIADVMVRTRSGYGAGRANYMAQLVAERLTGCPSASFSNAAMLWGIETEPEARKAYIAESLNDVVEVGFINHPEIENAGASPDGLVNDDGLVEIKCPNTATHINTLLAGTVKDCYVKQMMWQMVCTGRQWCDFVSFDPRMPDDLQYFCKRFEWDTDLIVSIQKEVVIFLGELDEKIKALESLRDGKV